MFAIIPARGGSKRLPNKNIRNLAGKPLLFHTIEAFLGHKEIKKIIFTTDSIEYAEMVMKAFPHDVEIEIRPESYAQDKTKVVYEIERILRSREIKPNEHFLVGLPTAPLRNSGHVKTLLEAFASDGVGRFSCCEYDFPTQFAFDIDSEFDWHAERLDSPMLTGNTRSQDIKKFYRPNGAIYLQEVSTFLNTLSFYSGAKAFVMDQISSTDVDTAADFRYAASLMESQNV